MTSCLSQGISSIIFMIIHKPEVLGQLMHMHKVIVPKVWLFKHLFCGLLLQEEISPVFEEHSKIQAGWGGFEVQWARFSCKTHDICRCWTHSYGQTWCFTKVYSHPIWILPVVPQIETYRRERIGLKHCMGSTFFGQDFQVILSISCDLTSSWLLKGLLLFSILAFSISWDCSSFNVFEVSDLPPLLKQRWRAQHCKKRHKYIPWISL